MSYPEFNATSILLLLLSVSSIILVFYYLTKSASRILRLEKKYVELIKSFSSLHDRVNHNKSAIAKKSGDINFIEGDMDLIVNDKKATFKALYYPRRVQRK